MVHDEQDCRVNVFFTVDTEFWPGGEYRSPGDYRPDFDRDIHGRTEAGDFGLAYQMQVLNDHGLRGVFHVEPLCAFAVGDEPLRETVDLIQSAGHDVELHLHAEWLRWMPDPLLRQVRGIHIRHFPKDEQSVLIAAACDKLRACGADSLSAFRAGNYGANFDTLGALTENGVRCDTSHNTGYLDSACDMPTDGYLLQPAELYGVVEYPITFVKDGLRRTRHLQLRACSLGEMTHALWQAWQRRWTSVVIVSHSFELIKVRGVAREQPRPDWIVIRRFLGLCKFLSAHADKFRSATFSELSGQATPAAVTGEPLHARRRDTMIRLTEQLRRRFV